MKSFLKLKPLVFLFFLIAILFSCKKDDEVEQRKGSVLFGFSISDRSGRIDEDVVLSHLIISAENDNGIVFEDEEISLVSFDNEYSTEPISLNAGSYRLTKFLVAGEDGTVYYATPMEGSELAYLVSDPLPIHIVVSKDEVIEVKPEVVSTDEGTVEDFGYGEFGFDIVETFDVLLGVFVYNEEESDFVLTDSEITIYGDSDSLTHQNLYAATNKLTLPDRFNEFTFEVTKDGYNPFSYTFSSDSIKSYQGNNANGPLEIVLASLNVSEGLVAYYPFNGNANDESDNSNHGSVNGASLTTDRNGNANSAYSFDGVNDYIELGDDFDYSEVTFLFWFKAENISSEGVVMLSSDHSTKTNGLFTIVVDEVDGIDYVKYIRNELNGESNIVGISQGEWHFATLVIDGLDFSYYLDGNLIESKNSNGNISSSNGIINATLGCTRLIDRFFTGSLDDVRVYDRVLSINEIDALHNEAE